MTVREYITAKLKPLNLTLTDADWSDIADKVNPDDQKTDANIRAAFTVLATSILPFYVNQAKSVSENGFSISFNEKGLLNFYSWLCGFLGLEDTLNAEADTSISDASDMW